MKKFFITVFVLLSGCFFFYAAGIIKFDEIRSFIKGLSKEETIEYITKNKDKNLEKELGWVFSVKSLNDQKDIVRVEMDQPSKDFKSNKPDLFFLVDKKYSKRLREYQIIYFSGKIGSFDASADLIEITDVFLSGIMR